MEAAPVLSQPFSVRATLREGWKLVRGTKLAVLSTLLPMFFVALIAILILSEIHLNNQAYLATLFYNLVSRFVEVLLLSGFLGGLVMIGVKRARHEAIRWSEGLQYFNKLPKLACIAYLEFLSMLLLSLILMIVSQLLLVKLAPHNTSVTLILFSLFLLALSFMLKNLFTFSFQLALDKGLSIISAIGRSVKTVSRHYWKVLAVIAILAITNMIGACLAGVGLLWTLPFSYNTIGVMYRELVDKGL